MAKVCLVFEGELYADEYSYNNEKGEHLEGVTYGIQLSDDRGFKFGSLGKHKMSAHTYELLMDYLCGAKDGIPVIGADRFGKLEIKRIEDSPRFKYDKKLLGF